MIELEALDLLELHLAVPLDVMGTDYGSQVATVYRRELDSTDPTFSIGVFLRQHSPMDRPEIGGNGEPGWSRFTFHIQTIVKSPERVRGETWSMQLTKLVRQALYRNAAFRSALLSLKVGDEPPYDRALKCGVLGTEYASGEVAGGMAFMSQTEFFLDAEGI